MSVINWKKILKCLIFIPIGVIIPLIIISALSLAYVFVKALEKSVVAYISYIISFYTLVASSIWCVKKLPTYYKNTRKRVYANKYANRYLTDVAYKTHISLYMSLAINLAYVVTNGISAYVYNSYWFATFAIYYAIMAIMRYILVRYVNRHSIGNEKERLIELKRVRICAYILLTVNVVLSFVVLMMVYADKGFEYKGVLIYVMAMYTFYNVIITVKDIVKYRKYNSPVMSITKVIKFTSALFSMLFLETAMFSQFGIDTPYETKKIFIMLTGAGISIVVVTMSIHRVVSSTKEIRTLISQQNNYRHINN